jgi:hypothetical protein
MIGKFPYIASGQMDLYKSTPLARVFRKDNVELRGGAPFRRPA